jgi:hypothetical protein
MERWVLRLSMKNVQMVLDGLLVALTGCSS